MLLQSIKLENFRQFIDEQIDFSTDKDRNVTLIIGENGTGKTTFAQAFFWCLYGETSFTDKIILNRHVAQEMVPNQVCTVRVVLCLVHGSASYTIDRRQDYKKSLSNKVQATNTVLNIALKTSDGNTRYLKPAECETEIKKILPKDLSTYFFFDGERIEKMSKEIASGRKSSGFSDAVVGLTGLKATLMALNHLNPTRSTSVMGQFNNDYRGDSSAKIQELTKKIEALQAELDRIEVRLSEIDDELDAARTSKARFEEEIKQYADGERLQQERDKLQKELVAARKLKAQFVKSTCNTFNNGMTAFFSMSMVKRALAVLSHSDFSGKDIPEMHTKTISYLLKRGTCICGTHLDPGSMPYTKVMELMDYLPPQSIGVTVGQFVKESRAYYRRDVSLFSDIQEQLGVISTQNDTIESMEADISAIDMNLDGDNVREQVRKLNTQIQACRKTISDRESEQRTLLRQQGEKNKDKKLAENERSERSLLDTRNRQIELYKAYTQRIYEDMFAEYKSKEREVREKLQNYMNEIFKFIYNGGLSLQIDEKYNITVSVTDYDGGVETSTAQSISVIFAFISAIIKMARENQQENGDEAYSEPYPLVMDAPLSSFDKRRIKAICSSLPEIAEQVIIFIKDTDGDLAEEHLGTKVMKRHYFEKIDEFHTRLI